MTYKNKNTYFLTRESTDAAVLLSSSGTLLGGSRLQVGFSSVLRVSPFSSDQQQPEACFSHNKWQKHKMTNENTYLLMLRFKTDTFPVLLTFHWPKQVSWLCPKVQHRHTERNPQWVTKSDQRKG